MSPASNRLRILEALRRGGQPLDDDRLSTAAGVYPRQQVNQICRALEKVGIVRRYRGPGEKLVNELIGADIALVSRDRDQAGSRRIADASEPIDMATDPMLDSPPGHSREQRDAERVMLDLLGLQLRVVLELARMRDLRLLRLTSIEC